MDIDARYEMLEKIGAGSYATVYRARDLELGREVAIKQIHSQYLDDPQQLARYWQEAQLLASLHHPNIVTIFDIYRERGWLILELMQSNLAERMAGRQMDLRALRTAVAHCLRALKYLHSRGIVHGDIKPSNMMIDARRRVKLGDFGLARRVSDEEGSLLKGTTKYMAPETVSDEWGEVGPASDLYSLGFAAYELMCGPNFETLFPGLSAFGRNKQVAWMMWHAAGDRRLPEIPRVLEGVPDDLAQVIGRLSEKDQSRRYKSADEALSDLNIDLKLVKKESEDRPAPEPEMDPQRKKRLLLAGGAMLVSLILCVVMLLLPGERKNTQTVHVGYLDAVLNGRRLKLVDAERQSAHELTVPKSARITLQRRDEKNPVLLEELRAGDRIEWEYVRENDEEVLVIRAARPVTDRGRVADVNLQESALTIELESTAVREQLSLRVPEGQEVYVNLSPETLSETENELIRERLRKLHRRKLHDIRPGDLVELSHLPEPGGVRGHVVAGPIFVERVSEETGRVSRVETAAEPPRLIVSRSGGHGALELPVAPDATIVEDRPDGTTASLSAADLLPGDDVTFKYDRMYREIRVSRGLERVGGTVEAIDAPAGRIVISVFDPQKGTSGEMTQQAFDLAAGGTVRIAGDVADLDELRPGDHLTVLYRPGSGRPAATTITADRPPRSDRRALVAAVQSFDDKSLARLPYSIKNKELIRRTLVERYQVMSDPAANRLADLTDPTRGEIQSALSLQLRGAGSGTQMIVYLSTHGFVQDGRVYLAGRKFDSDRIAETGLPLDWIVERLDACPARDKILLLDLCHAETGERWWQAQPSSAEMVELVSRAGSASGAPEASGRPTVIIAGCRRGQRGRIWDEKGYGLFAWFVARGLSGQAEIEKRGLPVHVSGDDLFAYLEREMPAVRLPGGRTQQPAMFPAE